jgi:hypothetical protein
MVVVDPETEPEFRHELPVALMWGVGSERVWTNRSIAASGE